MDVQFDFLLRLAELLLLLLLFGFFGFSFFGSFLFLFDQVLSDNLKLLAFKIQIDDILFVIRSITNNTIFGVGTDLLESLSGEYMSASPNSNKLIEAIVF